jgi:hypothetical protein
MQSLHLPRFIYLLSPLLSASLLLSGCTTITYPDGTRVSTPYVPPPCEYVYGGGYPVYSTYGVGVYTGGYYPVYGNCFGSGWGSWGGWGWNRSGGCGYANNSGNTTINVNKTTTVTGATGTPYSRSVNGAYGHESYNHTGTYSSARGNAAIRSQTGTSGGGGRMMYGGGMRGMH